MSANQGWILFVIVLYFCLMLAIGVWSYRKTHNVGDYMLGGRDLSPFTAALSACAADMSGWLLMGLPGALFIGGLVNAWVAVGLTLGSYLNWRYIAPRLRSYTEIAGNAITVPRFFENRLHDKSHAIRVFSGLVILIFFTFYVSSGMVAGGQFFQSIFGDTFKHTLGDSYLSGLFIVAGVEIVYTFLGGFLAVSYTDMVQGTIMVIALIAVPICALIALGGPTETINAINQYDVAHHINHLSLQGTSVIAVISAFAWGLGYTGMPHVITRYMALRSPQDAIAGRRISTSWMILSVGGAVCAALIGVAFVQKGFNNKGFTLTNMRSGETVILDLGKALFSPIFAGFMLAAVLAAIMSTVSSQLIVASSALIEDIYRMATKKQLKDKHLVYISRASVLLISAVAIVMALNPSQTIFQLVAFAWAGFGSAFGPTVALCLYWRRLTTKGALAGMIAGSITVIIWNKVPFFSSTGIYEILPGVAINLLFAIVISLCGKQAPEVDEEFTKAVQAAKKFNKATGKATAS